MGTNDFSTGDFTPPAGHPRVYFRPKDIPRILNNMPKEQNARALAYHEHNLKDDTDGKLQAASGNSNYDAHILAIIESRAFEYVIRGNEATGKSAINSLFNFCKDAVFSVGDWIYNGRTVFTIAAVYDWCYPLLSEEDKTRFQDFALKIAAGMEIGWPPVKQGSVTGHGVENQLMRDLLCLALAVYDERPDIYEPVAGRFFKEYIEPKWFMYKARTHNQGSSYFPFRFQWEIMAALIMDAAGRPRIFGDDQQYVLYWALYARRPDGLLIVDGDSSQNNVVPGTRRQDYKRSMLHAGNYFNDRYLKGEALRELEEEKFDFSDLGPVEFLIFNNPDLMGKPVDDLPLSMYYPSPKGAVIARTGWEEGMDSPVVVAEMKINEWWFSNHHHLDAGAFQIYYKGALATDTGYYHGAKTKFGSIDLSTPNDGSTGYARTHDFNYNKRTIAHNCMLVYDPSEKMVYGNTPVVNDGGQRIPNNGNEPFNFEIFMDPAKGYRICEILGHEAGKDPKAPNYTYLKGDLTRAYSGKVKSYQRSFMFLNLKNKDHPAALVVFDRVESSRVEFKKTWLFHGMYEPSIEPSISASSAAPGAASRSVFVNDRYGYQGKLTLDTLLPAADNLIVEKIGGPDKEYLVNGVNYYAIPREGGVNEGGGWRLELSPRKAETLNYFLNVLQPCDAVSQVSPLAAEMIESSTHIGVAITGRVVLFGKDTARTKAAVSFSFGGSGDFEITVADLEAGEWEISGPERTTARVTAEGGVALFTGKPGAYTLMRR
jgi:hypothetical protein